MPSSVPSVFLITKSGIGAILSRSLFLDKICKTSRIVTASANGLSGSDCHRGTVGASTAFSHNLMDHLADCRQLGIVERLGSIVGRMIARVFTGREEEERNAAAPERAVIAAVENEQIRAEQSELQRTIARGVDDPGSESRGSVRCPSRRRAIRRPRPVPGRSCRR